MLHVTDYSERGYVKEGLDARGTCTKETHTETLNWEHFEEKLICYFSRNNFEMFHHELDTII